MNSTRVPQGQPHAASAARPGDGAAEGRHRQRAWRPWLDAACLLGLAAFAAAGAVRYVSYSAPPLEDAAMLMRYADNLAHGHGIVWNVGEKPVDGATDFLSMVLIALLRRTGLGLVTATRALVLTAHIATVFVVFVGVRRLRGSSPFVAAFSGAYLAIGPGLAYVSTCFATPVFAFFASVAWFLAYELVDRPVRRSAVVLFAVVCLLMGLVRPEGVFLALLMLAAVVSARGLRGASRVVVAFVLVFAVVGGAYFAWRWHYFGYPLPNPFYKKGGGHFYGLSVCAAGGRVATFLLPFWPPLLLGLRSRESMRRTLFAAIPVVGFTLLWVLLSDEMNFMGRFQYAVVPLCLISWPRLVHGLRRDWRLPSLAELGVPGRAIVIVFALVAGGWALRYVHHRHLWRPNLRDGRYDVALMLREYRDRGYLIATTEAGLLPLYSGWRALDTWGLNDQWIAHHGLVTQEYLDHCRPEVIMAHAYFSPAAGPAPDDAWGEMTQALWDYARSRRYAIAAVYGLTPDDTHHYYVRPDFKDSEKIVRQIREMDYRWFMNGKPCVDFASRDAAPGQPEEARP